MRKQAIALWLATVAILSLLAGSPEMAGVLKTLAQAL